jgi:crossover junction endodeoxyribonuclease RuvC
VKILGIDPGSLALGYGIIEVASSKMRAVEYGVIKLSPKDALPFRLCAIYDVLKEIIQKHKPGLITVETPFFGKNAHSSFVLGHARGTIMLVIGQYVSDCTDTKYLEFTPTQIKKAVTGNGLAEKHQVEYMVSNILGLGEVKVKDDAFDALACAICGYNHFNSPV